MNYALILLLLIALYFPFQGLNLIQSALILSTLNAASYTLAYLLFLKYFTLSAGWVDLIIYV